MMFFSRKRKAKTDAYEFKVLMVCMGNICRSPTAEAVLRAKLQPGGLADRVGVDSAGTHGHHGGSPPDGRAVAHARKRGFDLSGLQARRVRTEDFQEYDLILAMDQENLVHLQKLAPPELASKIKLLMDFSLSHAGHREIPDPYYGSAAGFDHVLDLIEDACDGLVAVLRRAAARAVSRP